MSLGLHALAYHRGVRAHRGSKLRALEDVRRLGMAYYDGPYSTGFETTIPRGTILEIYSEPGPWGLMLCTIRDREVQKLVVPPYCTGDEKYSGCAFMFGLHELGRIVELTTPASPGGVWG